MDKKGFVNAIEEFIQMKQLENKKEATLAKYQNRLKQVASKLPGGAINEKVLYQFLLEYQQSRSPWTTLGMVIVLNDFLKFCKLRGYLKRPIILPRPKVPRKRLAVLTTSEQQELNAYLLAHMSLFHFSILLALHTGLRIGELAAIQIGDIKNNVLYVSKTLQRVKCLEPENGKKTKVVITEPKSQASIREIPLPGFITELYKNFQGYPQESYLLTGDSTYMEPRTIERRYKILLERCSIPYRKFHVLRHTFATDAMRNGFDPKALSEVLGHASVSTTLQLYVHPDFEAKKENMGKIQLKMTGNI